MTASEQNENRVDADNGKGGAAGAAGAVGGGAVAGHSGVVRFLLYAAGGGAGGD